jgi:hypothetical protein
MQLVQSELNWKIAEKELFAYVYVARKLHDLLLGVDVTLYLDHRNWLFLTSKSDHVSPRVQRWRLLLGQYKYGLAFVPGQNNAADLVSRWVPHDVPTIDLGALPTDVRRAIALCRGEGWPVLPEQETCPGGGVSAPTDVVEQVHSLEKSSAEDGTEGWVIVPTPDKLLWAQRRDVRVDELRNRVDKSRHGTVVWRWGTVRDRPGHWTAVRDLAGHEVPAGGEVACDSWPV